MRHSLLRPFLLLGAALCLGACGIYSFSGTSIQNDVQSIHIEYFEYKAQKVNPSLSSELTNTTSGSTYEKTFTYTLPADMRADHTWAAAFVSNYDANNANNCNIANGAKTGFLMQEKDPTSGIAGVEASINVVTYPNPATEMAFVTAEGTIRSYEMVDALGRKVMSQENVNADILELNVNSLSAGVYFISVTTDNGVATQRLTVAK